RLWVSLQNSGVFQNVNIQSVSLEDKVQNLALNLIYNGPMSPNASDAAQNSADSPQPNAKPSAPKTNSGDSKGTTKGPKVPPINTSVTKYPGIPRNISATVQVPDKVDVNWDNAEGAVSYNVYRAPALEGSYIKVGNVTTNHFVDPGLTQPLTYYYKVSAVNKGGIEGNFGDPVGVTGNKLEAPSGVSIIPAAPGQISISWNKLSSATAYKVYRGESENGPFVVVGIVTETKLLDSGLTVGIYYYKISALSEGLEGPSSVLDSIALVNGK
ncbi:MAG: hypothetical protein Q8912_14045, partial [Bacillota bacterium]|nr:hypothetical protein [Bacillota bacterium]